MSALFPPGWQLDLNPRTTPLGPTKEQVALTDVLNEVYRERARQEDKWGQQNHPDGTGRPDDRAMADFMRAKCQANSPQTDNYRDILEEEVHEAFAETDPELLRRELIHVAAVAVAWIECIDRRSA